MGAKRLKYCVGTAVESTAESASASVGTLLPIGGAAKIHPFFLTQPVQLPVKPQANYHSNNQMRLWEQWRSFFVDNNMLFPCDSFNQSLASSLLHLLVKVFWELSPYSSHFVSSSSLPKANAMSPVLLQFFGYRQVGENVLMEVAVDNTSAGSGDLDHMHDHDDLTISSVKKLYTGHKASAPSLSKAICLANEGLLIQIDAMCTFWRTKENFKGTAAVLKSLRNALTSRYCLLQSDSGKKVAVREKSVVRTFEQCGELFYLSPRPEAEIRVADIIYEKLDNAIIALQDYGFVAITDEFIFAGPGADEVKKRLAQKRLISTIIIYRKMWFDELPKKLSHRVEIVVWNTGNNGYLKFAIRLPPSEDETNEVQLFSARQRVLAEVPRYATAKELHAAKELLDAVLPLANGGSKGGRLMVIRILTGDSRVTGGNQGTMQKRLDDFVLSSTFLYGSYFILVSPSYIIIIVRHFLYYSYFILVNPSYIIIIVRHFLYYSKI